MDHLQLAAGRKQTAIPIPIPSVRWFVLALGGAQQELPRGAEFVPELIHNRSGASSQIHRAGP